MNMKDHVKRYVAHMQSLGRKYKRQERCLLSWAATAMSSGETIIRAETMVQWAQQTSSDRQMRERMAVGRRFARWLHAEDERHEVAHEECLGHACQHKRIPCLPSDAQLGMLMDAALDLSPTGSIKGYTMHCIIGLIAVTGLRRSEVCSLRVSDFTEDGLVIRQTKFSKSRLVPLSDSTRKALHEYLRRRGPVSSDCDHLFVLSPGRSVKPNTLTKTFTRLALETGLRDSTAEPGTTLHDLRHRFAVRSLEQAISTNRDDISRHILALSTYLGHAGVSSTYWYLHATPVLLKGIAENAEALHAGRIPS